MVYSRHRILYITGTMDGLLASLYKEGRKLGGGKQQFNFQVTEWECQKRGLYNPCSLQWVLGA